MSLLPREDYHIGIFDSGLGGLTVLKEIKRAVPKENLVYFGDTARVPYGGKSAETLIRYSIENSLFLLEKQLKMLVVACNTAASYSTDKLKQLFNIPVIDVIEPGAEKAVQVTQTGKIAVLGTKATVSSNVYRQAILKKRPKAEVLSVACPLLVPLVEEKWLNHPVTRLVVKEYLKEIEGKNIDTVVLACTHYPVLKNYMQEELGPDVTIVDSACTCADKIAKTLETLGLENRNTAQGLTKYYVSDDPEKFRLIGKDFLGQSIDHVELVSLNYR